MAAIRKNNQKGLSLIEVLASLVLLSLLACGMLVIFSPAARWIVGARHETTAVYFAAAILENLRWERTKIDPLNSGKNAQEIGLNVASSAPGMVGEISLMQAMPYYPNLYDVMVTVTWMEGKVPRSLSMSTIIRKN